MAGPGSSGDLWDYRADPADRPRPRLDRDEIVRAAQELIDAHGVDAFSMRKLATVLEVKSPSLYWHVPSKEALFDLLVDTVLGRCPLPPGDQPWADELADLARNLRSTLLAHPAAAQLLPGRVPFGPHGLGVAEHVVSTLRRAGFSDRLASYGYVTLLFYVVGFASQQLAFGRGAPARARLTEISEFLAGLPVERYPSLVAVADHITGGDGLTARFELGLTSILRGLERELAVI